MVLKLLQLEDILHISAKEAKPHHITNYLYELTTLFMKFYENCPILRDDVLEETKESRLLIAKVTADSIKLSLGILGIGVLDRL